MTGEGSDELAEGRTVEPIFTVDEVDVEVDGISEMVDEIGADIHDELPASITRLFLLLDVVDNDSCRTCPEGGITCVSVRIELDCCVSDKLFVAMADEHVLVLMTGDTASDNITGKPLSFIFLYNSSIILSSAEEKGTDFLLDMTLKREKATRG